MPEKYNDEEEYQFPSDEYMGEPQHEEAVYHEEPVTGTRKEFTEPVEADDTKSGLLRNMRIIAVIGLAVIVLIVFTLLRPGKKTKVEQVAGKKTSTQQTITNPAPAIPKVSPTSAAATIPPAASTPITIPGTTDLSSLKQENSNNQQAIQQLQDKMDQLNAVLTQINTSQTQLKENITNMQDQVKQLIIVKETTVPKSVAQVSSVVKTKKVVVLKPPSLFFIRAVIPGRAWIITPDGHSVTVALGDPIPDYGLVTSIDAQQGVIYTSSGKQIKFPPPSI